MREAPLVRQRNGSRRFARGRRRTVGRRDGNRKKEAPSGSRQGLSAQPGRKCKPATPHLQRKEKGLVKLQVTREENMNERRVGIVKRARGKPQKQKEREAKEDKKKPQRSQNIQAMEQNAEKTKRKEQGRYGMGEEEKVGERKRR